VSDSQDSERRALQRILETPQLAKAVPRLPPELLHRVIQHQGLEDSAEIIALATPEQLARVFDLDLWQPARAGLDDQFDAERFGVWLHVLLENGAGVAARILAGMAPDLLTTGLVQHVRVFDVVTVTPYVTLEGELAGLSTDHESLTCDIGGFRLVALRTDAWDAILEALPALERAHGDCFRRVMTGCRALSSSRPEQSGMHDLLDDPDQAMFDLGLEREDRRALQGYVTAAQAQAFLEMARRTPQTGSVAGDANPIAKAYFRALDEQTRDAQPDRQALTDGAAAAGDATEADAGVAGLVEVLVVAGILAPPVRALPSGSGPGPDRLSRIHAALRVAHDRDPDVYATRSAELGYLANTLVSACSLQSRPFTPQEASDAAIAACNLGLENWPAELPDDVLVAHDLVGVFQIGWAVLYERVSLTAARRLLDTLRQLRSGDRETQIGISRLRIDLGRQLAAGTPWRARPALDVLTSLDLPVWAALHGLLDECPVFPAALAVSSGAGVHSVSATAFEFFSENAQIDAVDAFLASLRDALQG
jgi:hypothetical protein